MIELLNVDCMLYMKGLPDKAFDLAIVDPPYGINAPNMQMGNNAPSRNGKASVAVRLKKGRLNTGSGKLKDRLLNTAEIGWDYAAPPPEYFIELERVSINQIIWGGNYFDLGPTRCVISWDKCQPWENFSQWEMAWTSFDKPASLFKYSNTGGNPDKMDKIHPTQKPIKLYKWLLKKYANRVCNHKHTEEYKSLCTDCNKPFRILDTHLGSGSSAIAAHSMGFDFVGCELDKDYYDAACKRFKEQTAQQKLFI